MTPASAILDRTTLLVRDHLVDGVDGDIVALAFSRTLVGVVVNADLLGFRGFASALETFRVLMAGMCIPMRVEVLGAVPQFRFGPPFESESSFEAFLAYRSKASAAAALGTVNRSCAIRIGLGVSDSSLDFEIAANEAFCWVRQRGPRLTGRQQTFGPGRVQPSLARRK